MKTNLTVIAFTILITSCSSTSVRKSITYSSLAGCMAGGAGGYALSPEGDTNKRANTALFCGVGAIVAGAAGYLLFKDNPSNQKLKERVQEDERGYRIENSKAQFNVVPKIGNMKSMQVTNEEIPDHLKNRLPKNRLIKQEVQEQRITKDGETIIIEPHNIYFYGIEGQD